MPRERCKYLDEPAEAYIVNDEGMRPATSAEAPKLCSWANDAPNAALRLIDLPVWIQRVALSGAYMNGGDCENCRAFVSSNPGSPRWLRSG